jgi:hypothetical protein
MIFLQQSQSVAAYEGARVALAPGAQKKASSSELDEAFVCEGNAIS